jgi:hypothetical protein
MTRQSFAENRERCIERQVAELSTPTMGVDYSGLHQLKLSPEASQSAHASGNFPALNRVLSTNVSVSGNNLGRSVSMTGCNNNNVHNFLDLPANKRS